MKVKELIENLQKFDSDLDVFCWSEDENLIGQNKGSVLLDINHVETVEADKDRLENETPVLRLRKSSTSSKHVLIDVTSDF